VEGQTEEAITREVLVPCLECPGHWLSWSVLASTRQSSGAKVRGGVTTWEKIHRDVRELLRDTSIDVLTTMFDYYGMPADTPGMSTRPSGGPRDRVGHVESAMATAVASRRFRPHLTLRETETWVFAAAGVLDEHFGELGLGERVADVARGAGGPELVDDGPHTAPSKRLTQMCPSYRKVADGLATIRRA